MGNRAWRQRASRNRWGPYNWRVIRRHRWITEPPMCDPVLRPRPFTPRSLVGMTMGARKRAAQAAGVARSTYRIGQKLCPCAGCIRCQCRSAFDAWPELGEDLAKDHPTCDGSGVLPARKSK